VSSEPPKTPFASVFAPAATADKPTGVVTIAPTGSADLAPTFAATAATAGEPVSRRFEPGAIIAGRYRLVAMLGRGGMGEVYRADDLTLDQPVALKFLPLSVGADERSLARFHHELRVARQVSHRNVCRLYDVGEADGHRFLTMEYIDGEDLGSLLRRIGRLPQDKAVQIARQLCAGVAASHERGVLHRDLKPANVMIDGNGDAGSPISGSPRPRPTRRRNSPAHRSTWRRSCLPASRRRSKPMSTRSG
jgi:serine/threonine-protein kinase